jgi:hypothetical protein
VAQAFKIRQQHKNDNRIDFIEFFRLIVTVTYLPYWKQFITG